MSACVTFGLRTPGVRTGSARIALARRPFPCGNRTTTIATRARAMSRSPRVTSSKVGRGRARRKAASAAVSNGGSRLADMVEVAVRPRGPYSLGLSTRLAGDATRRVHEGLVTARCGGGVARAWQSPDGTVTIRSESEEAAEKLRWVHVLDDEHSECLERLDR